MGKCIVKLKIDGIVQVTSNVYYLLELKNNFLSIDQLQEKNLTTTFKKDMCNVYHQAKRMIIQ